MLIIKDGKMTRNFSSFNIIKFCKAAEYSLAIHTCAPRSLYINRSCIIVFASRVVSHSGKRAPSARSRGFTYVGEICEFLAVIRIEVNVRRDTFLQWETPERVVISGMRLSFSSSTIEFKTESRRRLDSCCQSLPQNSIESDRVGRPEKATLKRQITNFEGGCR